MAGPPVAAALTKGRGRPLPPWLSVPALDSDSGPDTGSAPVDVSLAIGRTCAGYISYTDLGEQVAYSMYVDCSLGGAIARR